MTRLLIALALAGCSPNISQEPEQPIGEGEQTETDASDVSMELTLNDLEPGDEVTSPLRFSGSASGLWYFEGDFPVRIVDGQGTVIAESYASAQSNWMTEGQVPFEGGITFDVTEPTEATLIFQEDDPSGMNEPAEHPVAVVLLPSRSASAEVPDGFPSFVALPSDVSENSSFSFGEDGLSIVAVSNLSLDAALEQTVLTMKRRGWNEVERRDVPFPMASLTKARLERDDKAVTYSLALVEGTIRLQVGYSSKAEGWPPVPVSVTKE
jgi:hypothetical protein